MEACAFYGGAALFEMSERLATTLVGADCTTIRYRSRRSDEAALWARLRDLAYQRYRFGYRRLHVLLQRDGEAASRNKVYRLYRAEGLGVRKTRRRAVGRRAPLLPAPLAIARWSLDFVQDQLACGRRFQISTWSTTRHASACSRWPTRRAPANASSAN